MSTTLEKVIADIKFGRSKRIYYSEACLWWTHLETDAIEATQRGIEYRKAIASFQGNRYPMVAVPKEYTDPLGNPVKVFPDPKAWMRSSMANPLSYGKHGLTAFMFTHHQNCADYFSNRWEHYNTRIDKLRKAERKK